MEYNEGVLVSRIIILNITNLPVNITHAYDDDLLVHIRAFFAMPLYWLKAIPDVVYGIGVVANILLAAYLIKYKRYRSPIFALILSMCLADTLMCASAIVWTTVRNPFLIGPVWVCSFSMEILYASIHCSEYHLVVISIVRFYQLGFPLSARAKLTSELIRKICFIVWVASVVHSLPFAILPPPISVQYEGRMYIVCSQRRRTLHVLYLGIVNVFLPFAVTALFHIAKHCIVFKSGAVTAISMVQEEQKCERTDTKAVMIVLTVYFATATPIIIVLFLVSLTYIPPLVIDIANKIMFLNSVLNPFIYAFAAQSVRSDVLRMFQVSSHL